MDGIHDLGGMQGFGKIETETDEPVFHHEWEKRVFALSMAAPFVAGFCDDQFRRQIEQLPPQRYLNSSYYQLWLEGMLGQLKELDIIDEEELKQAISINPLPNHFDSSAQASADGLMDIVEAGGSQAMPNSEGKHRFSIGDHVQTKSHISSVHTRLPKYARGKPGRIIASYGSFRFCRFKFGGIRSRPANALRCGI